MSKKKRSKKRERIPVIDTLIDLAGAMTLDYLAAKRRQKNGTKRSKKIDPYAATGAAMGMGLIKDTDDIIKFGGVLGAMGAFDSDDDLPISTAAYMAPRDNRYAWRLNCEDGSAYGIDPNDYETSVPCARVQRCGPCHRECRGPGRCCPAGRWSVPRCPAWSRCQT